jgi:diphthamide synthase (EF-2-diphthine--ammonia ligase)
MERRAAKISAPALLHGSFDSLASPVDVLFWSGGKDSFLAARALRRERGGAKNHLLLVTTFDSGSRTVAHQELPITTVQRQAQVLGIPLLGIPLWSHIPYAERIGDAFGLIAAAGVNVERVCSGDLNLQSVGQWREDNIAPLAQAKLSASLHAPLWNVCYETLMADLVASGTPCRVCALGDVKAVGVGAAGGGAQVGDLFDSTLLARLDAETDAFGENGEFHTLAEVWNASKSDPLI